MVSINKVMNGEHHWDRVQVRTTTGDNKLICCLILTELKVHNLVYADHTMVL